MTTAYTSLLGLALPVTGELSGTWGDTVNTAITSLLDTAVAGTTSITTDSDITLTTTTGASNQARQAIILWNPASGTTTRYITAPAQSKLYTVINASGGTQSVVIRGAGPTTGVTIAKGESAMVAWNGSDFVKVSSSGGAITFTDLTVTGNTILGDAAADTLTVNATSTFASPVNFQGLVKLPSTGRSAAAALTTTNPAFLYGVASTYTDTTSSGTVAFAPFYLLAQPTLSTSNVTTYTNAATLYIANAPTAGGSATITNPYSLYVAAGANYLGGALTVGGATALNGDVTLGDASGDSLTVNAGTTTFVQGVANTVPFLNASKVFTTSLSAGGLGWTGQILGVGQGPNAWGSNWNGLQITNGTSYARSAGNSSHLVNNVYNDNANWRYIGNAAAAQIVLGDGNMTFQTAATGTTGGVATFGTGIYIDQLGEGVGLFGASAAIPTGMTSLLALGDSDTGIAWESDGAIHTYVNNVKTITYYSGSTIFQQNVGILRSPSYPLDVGGNARIMGVTAFNDNVLRMSLPSGTTGNINQILFRDQGDTNTTAAITAYGSAYGSGLNNAVRIGMPLGNITLDGNGNVSIGADTSASSFTRTLTVNAASGSSGSVFQVAGVTKAFLYTDGTSAYVGANTGGSLILKPNDTNAMWLNSSGQGSIGVSGSDGYMWKVVTPLNTSITNKIQAWSPSALEPTVYDLQLNSIFSGSSASGGFRYEFSQRDFFTGSNTYLTFRGGVVGVGGFVPPYWDSSVSKAVQIGLPGYIPGAFYQTLSGVMGLANNYYYNGGDIRVAAGYSSRYYQYDGEHFFQVASSSTAGSGISWTNGMAINRTGTLLATGDAASDGSIKGLQTGNGGFVERDYATNSGSSRTIVVAGTYNYKFEITVMVIGNSVSSQIGEGRWIAGRRDYSGANHIYNSANLVGNCVSFSTSQSTSGAQCTYTITITNNQDSANNHWIIKVRLVNSDSFSYS